MRKRTVVLAALALLLSAPAYAQRTTATIRGAIRDATQAVLPGVTVTIVNEQTGFTRTTVTNEVGTVTSASDFHVRPTVTGFTPTAGAAGETVTITGNALNGATGVRFGTADATVLGGGDASQVMAIVPGTATTGPITVITVEGSDTSSDDFEVLGPMASAPRWRFTAPSR